MAATLGSAGAAGNQTVQLGDDSQFSGAVTVAFGGGEDQAYLNDVTVGGIATVNLGSGNDQMEALGSTLNAVNINLGGGEDSLTAGSVSFDQPWDIDGGNGHDTYSGTISVLARMELWNFERVILNPVIA